MKHNEWENDGFDELLRDALASDAAPSGDFTERLMEQVRRTPQEKAKNRPYKKILAAVAACAVIAAAIPLVMPRGNSTASADNAAPMMDMTADDGAYDNEYMTSGAPSGDREPADSQQKVTEDAKNGADDLPLIDAIRRSRWWDRTPPTPRRRWTRWAFSPRRRKTAATPMT